MKAMRIHLHGPANGLTLDEVALPRYTGGDVPIRVVASGVNLIDWKIRSGAMAQPMRFHMPLTLGWECATQVALMPSSVSFSVAATLPITAQTAWSATEAADLHSGHRVAIHGGAGGVWSLAIQLAKFRGAKVTTTASSRDTAGGSTEEASWDLFKLGGILVKRTRPAPQGQAEAAGLRTKQVMTRAHGNVVREIATLVEVDQLLPLSCESFQLSDPIKVHQRGEAANLQGRTALLVGST